MTLQTLKRWIGRTGSTVAATDRDLLDTIRPGTIPDPAILRDQWSRLIEKIAATDAEWERLDRRGDPSAFLRLQPLAEQLQRLRTEADELPMAIESAERRRASFLEIVQYYDAIMADEAASLRVALEQPAQDARGRDRQIRELDAKTRLRSRLASQLWAVSSHRRFREAVVNDALRVLRGDLELRLRELDRLRVPGNKPRVEIPPQLAALLHALEGQTSRREPSA